MEYGNMSNQSLSSLEKGFVDKETILEFVTQEEIFSLVFGYIPEEFEYSTSPFREDTNPKCFFQYLGEEVLYFRDFGNSEIRKGTRMSHLDCFNAVMFHFSLPNFYSTLIFIYNSLIKDKQKEKILEKQKRVIDKEKFLLFPYYRSFDIRDKMFWFDRYGISSYNLDEDLVYATDKYICLNSKTGDHLITCKDVTYTYTDFDNNSIKIYSPYTKGVGKFITDNTKCSISGMRHLPFVGDIIIIAKSYKDYRVLRNEGYYAVWVSSESSLPDDEDLKKIIPRFRKIIVWFDNDETGINMAKQLADYINSIYPSKAIPMWLPQEFNTRGIKDPADFREESHINFKTYLKTFI